MPDLNARNLHQTAVYWGSPVQNGWGGYTFASGVEIEVRWEDRTDRFLDPQGVEQISRAQVRVDRDVDVGGYLFLGDLDDLSSAGEDDPTVENNAFVIRRFTKTPSLRARWSSRKVWL